MEDGRIPNLFVIGAMKASTSTLCATLAAHPEIALGREKEARILCLPEFTDEKARLAYNEFYRAARGGCRYYLDGSPQYTYSVSDEIPDRLRRLSPDAKLIYILRDPKSRMLSHYRHYRTRQKMNPPRFPTMKDALLNWPELVEASCYSRHLERYEALFGPDRIYVLVMEEYVASPSRFLDEIARFLDLSDPPFEWPSQLAHVNTKHSLALLRRFPLLSALMQRGVMKKLSSAVPAKVKSFAADSLGRGVGEKPYTPTPEEGALMDRLLQDELPPLQRRLGSRIAEWPAVKSRLQER